MQHDEDRLASDPDYSVFEEITTALHQLKLSLLRDSSRQPEVIPNIDRNTVICRIESCVLAFLEDLVTGGNLQLRYQRSGTSVQDPCRVVKAKKKKCALMLHLLSVAHQLLVSDTISTKRDIYYEDVSLWGHQQALDVTVTEVTRLLGVPRHLINIRATSKGLVAGPLTFLDGQKQLVNCDVPNGVLIPSDIEQLTELRSPARCILVIEKDATFQKLIDDDVQRHIGPCILMTGKGYPDVATRRMLSLLWSKLQIPPLALVDADPHGISIMAVYRFGSQGLDDVEKLAVPQLRWLGIHPTDVSSLRLPDVVKLALGHRDLSLLSSLAQRNFISSSPHLVCQLDKLREENCKVEIQSLTKLSAHYLTRTYLPSKIRAKAWL